MIDAKGNPLFVGDEVVYINREEKFSGTKKYTTYKLATGIITKITAKCVKINEDITRHESTCMKLLNVKCFTEKDKKNLIELLCKVSCNDKSHHKYKWEADKIKYCKSCGKPLTKKAYKILADKITDYINLIMENQ